MQENCRCFYGSGGKLSYVKLINAKTTTKNFRSVLYFKFYSGDVPWVQTSAQQCFGRGKGQADALSVLRLGAAAAGVGGNEGSRGRIAPLVTGFFSYFLLFKF